jgi:hypothetical protein
VNDYLAEYTARYLAKERAEEANRHHLASIALQGQPSLSSRVRRSLAQGLAAFSRGSASIVRRLDSCIADDLGRTLAPTE